MNRTAVHSTDSLKMHRKQSLAGNNAGEEGDTPIYKNAFPPLSDKVAPPVGTQKQTNAGKTTIRSAIITKVFHVPLEQRKHNREDQVKICERIKQRTGAQLELHMTKDQGLSIMVSGNSDAVMKAHKQIVYQLHAQESDTLDIPKEYHGFVIGKNGTQLRELQIKTDTTIVIPKADDPSSQIKISGTKEGIEKAKHEILLISAAEQDKRAVERVNIEKVYHPFITGAYNKVLKKIVQETGAHIYVPPLLVSTETEIVITGRKKQVFPATAMIKKIYDDKKKRTTSIAVEVKKSQHKYVIGPKANNLQEILDKTGVSVEVPLSSSTSETVILRGEPGCLVQALTEVYIKATSNTVSFVSAPSWLHRFIIGKNGQTLVQLTQHMPRVDINFIREKDKVILDGPTKAVQMLQSQIEAIVADVVSRMDYAEISVDPEIHKKMVGNGGVIIKCISEQHKVTVYIRPDNERGNLICIEGDPQGVQEAKKELLELASRLENELTMDLNIDKRFYNGIIGRREEKIKDMCDKFPGVIIIFPNPAQKRDIIQLRGPRTEVEQCSVFLHERVAEIANTKQIEVRIPKNLHTPLIGPKGCLVRAIMEEFDGVHIQFPTASSKTDTVSIRGPAENVEKAKQRLLDLAQEKARTNFKVTMTVAPKYHAIIIGSKGATIRAICTEHKVKIGLPTRNDEYQDHITITGIEEKVIAARDAIQAIVDQNPDWITKSIFLDKRIHGRIIGAGGKEISKIVDQFKVNVKFSHAEAADPNVVTVTGHTKLVEEAIDHLLKLENQYVEDYESKMVYVGRVREIAGTMHEQDSSHRSAVSEAPPTTANEITLDFFSNENFPSIATAPATKTAPWGARPKVVLLKKDLTLT